MLLDSLTPAPAPAAQTPSRSSNGQVQSEEAFELPSEEAAEDRAPVRETAVEPRSDQQTQASDTLPASAEEGEEDAPNTPPAQVQPPQSAADSAEVVLTLDTPADEGAAEGGSASEQELAQTDAEPVQTAQAAADVSVKPLDPSQVTQNNKSTERLPVEGPVDDASRPAAGAAKEAPSPTPLKRPAEEAKSAVSVKPSGAEAQTQTLEETDSQAAPSQSDGPVVVTEQPAETLSKDNANLPQSEAPQTQAQPQDPAQGLALAQPQAETPPQTDLQAATTERTPAVQGTTDRSPTAQGAPAPSSEQGAPAQGASPKAEAQPQATTTSAGPVPGAAQSQPQPTPQAELGLAPQGSQPQTEAEALAAPGQQARARQSKSEATAEASTPAVPAGKSDTEKKASPALPGSSAVSSPATSQPSATHPAPLPPALQSLLSAEPLTALSAERLIQATSDVTSEPIVDFDGELGLIRQDSRGEALRPANQTAALARFTPQTTQTLAAQIARKFSDGARVFDIRLDPQELGRVDVRLELGPDNRVSAVLSAERTETLAELQRSARDLERALQDAGLDLSEDGLSFNLSDGSNPFEDSDGYEAFASEPEPDFTLTVETPVSSDAPEQAVYGFAVSQRTGLNVMA